MNIYDIAKKANVSPATVSRVLNGNQSVREKTRKKVQQIIDESNYVPNSLARSLSVGDIRNIAFLAAGYRELILQQDLAWTFGYGKSV